MTGLEPSGEPTTGQSPGSKHTGHVYPQARRAIAMYRFRQEPIDTWFASQIQVRGITESAAFAVALEAAAQRDELAELYRLRYPDRQAVFDQYLATLHNK